MTTVLERATRRPVDRTPDGATDQQLRLLVVDDHPAVRRGLRELLEDQLDFHVVGMVDSAEDALPLAQRTPFDLALVDYHLGGRSGLWLSRKLKRLPEPPKVVIYSAFSDGLLAAAAVVAESDGLVSKGDMGSDLADAIREIAAGHGRQHVVPLQLAEVIRHRLADREQAIYGMLLAGMSLDEIARTLDAKIADVDSTLWAMLGKLDPVATEQTYALGGTDRGLIDFR